jgi:hypothetical protein
MKKTKIALVISLVLVAIMATAAFADFTVVNYDDTRSNFTPPEGNPDNSLIRNGDFLAWTGGSPDHWTAWPENKAGWEVHLANVDLSHVANRPEGVNDGLGFFIRNIGGSGSYSAGAWQHLDKISTSGQYVVNVSGTSWYGNQTGAYNTVAWYGIGDSESPSSVMQWRELYSDRFVCRNIDQVCNYIGRHETIMIEPGQYFHLKVTHKFPFFNSWSVWVLDDISIVPADGSKPATAGYYNWVDERDNNVVIRWNRHAPR